MNEQTLSQQCKDICSTCLNKMKCYCQFCIGARRNCSEGRGCQPEPFTVEHFTQCKKAQDVIYAYNGSKIQS